MPPPLCPRKILKTQANKKSFLAKSCSQRGYRQNLQSKRLSGDNLIFPSQTPDSRLKLRADSVNQVINLTVPLYPLTVHAFRTSSGHRHTKPQVVSVRIRAPLSVNTVTGARDLRRSKSILRTKCLPLVRQGASFGWGCFRREFVARPTDV